MENPVHRKSSIAAEMAAEQAADNEARTAKAQAAYESTMTRERESYEKEADLRAWKKTYHDSMRSVGLPPMPEAVEKFIDKVLGNKETSAMDVMRADASAEDVARSVEKREAEH